MRRQRGFSLVEMVIATALTMALVASVFAMVHPSHGAFETGLEAADMQQRLRVAVDALTRDLGMAGAGAYAGGQVGPLIRDFAPVLPFRHGLSGDAGVGVFRSDLITVISVPSTAAQTTLAADLIPGAITLQAAAAPGCPAGTNLCGFASGVTILVYDDTGAFETFTIATVADAAAQLTLTARPAGSASTVYRAGSNLVEARVDVYFLKADAASQTYQLMHYDGSANPDVPVVDHVVGLAFEYYGEAPGSDPASPLVPLTAAELVDGPWRPDDTDANRWDADLLRIRKISVTIRVEAAAAALRGPAGALFANGGSSRDGHRWMPDQEIRFHVSPRNMNLARP
jgi:Tfp pilus assembly protein PilW